MRGLPLGPAVFLLAVFLGGPILYCIYAVVHRHGADRRVRARASSGSTTSCRRSPAPTSGVGPLHAVLHVVSAIIGQNVLGMLLALLMRSAARPCGPRVVSAIVIGAWVLPEVVAGYLWLPFLGDDGTLNAILGWFGAARAELAVHHPDPGRVPRQHLARHRVLDAGLLGRAVRGAQGDRGGRAGRRRRHLRGSVLGHAADDPAHDRDQPDADHPADALGVRADLDDDQGRPEQTRARRCRCSPTSRRSSSPSSATARRSR